MAEARKISDYKDNVVPLISNAHVDVSEPKRSNVKYESLIAREAISNTRTTYSESIGHDQPYEIPVEREEIMSDPTREEIDAKILAAESRIETRIAVISGDIKLMSSNVSAMSEKIGEVSQGQKSTKVTIIVTAIAVVIALVAAVWQMQTGLLDALQTGISISHQIDQTVPKNK